MEFYLSFNNLAEVLQLPVPPSEFTIQKGHNINTININSIGEITVIGKGKLAAITIESFFPSQYYSFCQYKTFPQPYDCVRIIEKWKESGKPIRLLITDTNINMPVAIEEFQYGERDGTKDVYFSLSLKEYRYISVSTLQVATLSSVATSNARPVEKESSNTYTVKKGDTLWAISKQFYGSGTKYPQIAAKNNIKNPNKIYPGQVLVL